MLASLFRGNTGQRSSQYIESVTDDAHTRSLLFGQSQHVFNLANSPPPSPFGSPSQRPTSFDDQGGLELEEKDVRVLLAQDAVGGDERPTLLFDNKRLVDAGAGTASRKNQPEVRTHLPDIWRASQSPTQERAAENFRNRSSTFSGSQSSWAKANRDLTPKGDPYLECMFGAPSSTKTASSTKLHIIPANPRQSNAPERLARRPLDHSEQQKRTPLSRALTSGQQPTLSTYDDNRDSVLITRLFHVALDEDSKVADTRTAVSAGGQDAVPVSSHPMEGPQTTWKPPKLVERKVPAFAIGIVLQLPFHMHRPRSSQARPPFSPTHGQNLSASSSYDSDMQSSWTFLDAIPASLSSSQALSDDGDRRVDQVVNNWDVITRSISRIESVAVSIISDQLQSVIKQMAVSYEKAPKEKSMQRINQRTVAIHDVESVARNSSLILAATNVSRRIVYAIRIPRVVTGLGFTSGHWIDEARVLFRICGNRQQNFFLFNLLTAFLGNHTQWLERLAPEWYRKQFHATHRRPQEAQTLASRTVIVSEHKGLARRLIYVLASFLPGRGGIDVLQRLGEDDMLNSLLSSSSPSIRYNREPSMRTLTKPSAHNPRSSSQSVGASGLSTSVSSHDSRTSTSITSSPRKNFIRKDSNKFLIQESSILTMPQDENMPRRSGAGATSTVVPNAPATPTAYISSIRDSYFPEHAISDSNDSIASADLAKVLHKSNSSRRRSSSVSSKWGSLVSGISEMWSNRPATPGDRGIVTTASQGASSAQRHQRTTSSVISSGSGIRNPLQMMVDELDHTKQDLKRNDAALVSSNAMSPERQANRILSTAPRLFVDDKDGVVDVELDLPGFMSFSNSTPSKHLQPAKIRLKNTPSNRDRDDSVCSLRSIPMKGTRIGNDDPVNVGGYLRRHHEDFVLHAVKPYADLTDDIKRSMQAEPTPPELKDQILQEASTDSWIPVCTTLIADTKSFSIHRLTLRRRYEITAPKSAGSRSPATIPSSPSSRSHLLLCEQEITDEIVMEFDTTLADAIEKVLNVGVVGSTRVSTAGAPAD
ncbi:hypothetical protein H2198_008547, partial [Neophaeococcomyces mojaviensis]